MRPYRIRSKGSSACRVRVISSSGSSFTVSSTIPMPITAYHQSFHGEPSSTSSNRGMMNPLKGKVRKVVPQATMNTATSHPTFSRSKRSSQVR